MVDQISNKESTMKIRYLVAACVLFTTFANVEACPFRRARCRVVQRHCQTRFFVSSQTVVTPNIAVQPSVVIQPSTITQPDIVQQPGVIPVKPSTETAPEPSELGPPAPSLELVKSSDDEETPLAFSIVKEPEFILIDQIDFRLSSRSSGAIDLTKLESVKAYQEDTPNLNLSGLGEVKASSDETTENKPIKAAKIEENDFGNNFALTDEVPEEEYPAPTSEISGSEVEYKVGDLIELAVRPMAEKPNNLISIDYTWTILPNIPSRIWPDKSKILFGTGPKDGTYVVILNTSYVFGERDPQGNIQSVVQKTAVTMADVNVGNGVVTISPSGLSGLSRLAYEWTNDVIKTDTYDRQQWTTDAAKLAESFKTIAGEIQSGALTDVGAILKRTKDNNNATMDNHDQWLPWFTKMTDHLQASFNNGTIKTVEDYNKAWLEIANGLETASRE